MNEARFQLPAAWPLPHDRHAADRLVEQFAARGPGEAGLAGRPEITAMLAALGGNSPFLTDLALREADTLVAFIEQGPAPVVRRAIEDAARAPPTAPRAEIAARLRRAKRIVALVTALADIGGVWSLAQVTEALTELADTALRIAVAHLLRAGHAAGALHLPHPADPARGSGFAVLGMGKLGARELNYSSDVDLILLYDPANGSYTGEADAIGGFFTRLARGLVALMEARDADGYVFRTDLRLRPDPAATPPAVAIDGAIAYYESMGQNWERAAMIKARPVAGDLATGAGFLEAIRPFVWRRGLDFASVADIHAMKLRIAAHRGAKSGGGSAKGESGDPISRVAGRNVKLDEGGIREIEFLAQTLQMVWGGRDPALRVPTTIGALRLLARAGHIPPGAEPELAEAYRFLRTVEHRLQMVHDRQVHTLPDRAAELARFASFLGFADADRFAATLTLHLSRVRARYAEVVEQIPDLLPEASEFATRLDFSGVDAAPEPTASALRALGFANVERIVAAVRGWQVGRVRALRSERAREMLQRMLPGVLAELGRQPQPDLAFARFDSLIAQLPAGVQILSLFQRNPPLLARIADVLGAAPSLADHLARHPAALDGLLSPEQDTADPERLLATRLEDARLLEDAIAIIRRTVREEDFSIAVATLEGRLDADAAGLRRTALADAAIAALLPRVLADFSERHGRVRGGAMVVVALGKAGGREMMAGSDLDLMLVYHHPESVAESHGARRMAASQWFIRAVQAFISAVTAPGADGPLYAVDMRLRPSGNKGPVAVSLASLRRYHEDSAWTWERLALTRARVVAGPAGLRGRVQSVIDRAMRQAGPPERILADTAAMRARLARELPPASPWDVKHLPGGQMEVEFIAQALQLVHARRRKQVRSPTSRVALAELAQAGVLSAEEAATLIGADHLWRTVQGMLRIAVGRNLPASLPEASALALLHATGTVDLARLQATLDETASKVRAAFVRHIGEIGA